jgi:hypothetical protein
MNKLLLSFALLCAYSGYAQHFEIGLSGGIVEREQEPYIYTHEAMTEPQTSVKAMYITSHYQVGISADYRVMSCRWIDPIGGDMTYNSNAYAPPPGVTYQGRNTEVPLKAFVNRKVCFKSVEAYAGVCAGYTLLKSQQRATNPQLLPFVQGGEPVQGSWWRPYAGLQVGATLLVTKRIGINAEADGDCPFTILPYVPFVTFNNGLLTFKEMAVISANVGIHYRF